MKNRTSNGAATRTAEKTTTTTKEPKAIAALPKGANSLAPDKLVEELLEERLSRLTPRQKDSKYLGILARHLGDRMTIMADECKVLISHDVMERLEPLADRIADFLATDDGLSVLVNAALDQMLRKE